MGLKTRRIPSAIRIIEAGVVLPVVSSVVEACEVVFGSGERSLELNKKKIARSALSCGIERANRGVQYAFFLSNCHTNCKQVAADDFSGSLHRKAIFCTLVLVKHIYYERLHEQPRPT